jgi:hypothetical protein
MPNISLQASHNYRKGTFQLLGWSLTKSPIETICGADRARRVFQFPNAAAGGTINTENVKM